MKNNSSDALQQYHIQSLEGKLLDLTTMSGQEEVVCQTRDVSPLLVAYRHHQDTHQFLSYFREDQKIHSTKIIKDVYKNITGIFS